MPKAKTVASKKPATRKPAAKSAATPAKKTTTRKVVAKSSAKKTPVAKPARKTTRKPAATAAKTVRKAKTKAPRQTKAALLQQLADKTATDRKTAKAFVDALGELMTTAVSKSGPGVFTLPGLLKVTTRHVPARKGGAMVLNRFTGEMVKQKAKPASVRVKVRALTGLKASA
jgi:nucleoid DNA-binding protein